MPVDQYIGGVEHAILHLLTQDFYAISYENEKFNLKEPLMDFLLKEWSAMKPTKIENNWVSPDEIQIIDGENILKKIQARKLKLVPQSDV